MPIPSLDIHGLLPHGVHDCTLSEIDAAFGWNPHRKNLFQDFKSFLFGEIRPVFSEPVYCDGSFVTDKEQPADIDVILDLRAASDDIQWQGYKFMRQHQSRIKTQYRVDFWINIPANSDFCTFFQYIGAKTAQFKGLNPKHHKGILRLV